MAAMLTVPVPAFKVIVSALPPVVPVVVPETVILPAPTEPWVDKVKL